MQMSVLAIVSGERIDGSAFTSKIFDKLSPPVCAVMLDSAEDVMMLRTRFHCETPQFVMLDERTLYELQKLDPEVKPLGQINSAEIKNKKNILGLGDMK